MDKYELLIADTKERQRALDAILTELLRPHIEHDPQFGEKLAQKLIPTLGSKRAHEHLTSILRSASTYALSRQRYQDHATPIDSQAKAHKTPTNR